VSKGRREAGAGGEREASPRRHKRPRPEDLDNLSANILAFRTAAKLNQEELADKAKIARSHVGALEKGKLDARLSTLGALADAFKRPITDLLRKRGKRAK
jgi:DNA-binding XRE family transcriptional regulator